MPVSHFRYGWTALATLLTFAMVQAGSAANVTYTYDALGRLQSVIRSDGSSTTYNLDAAGNRTSVSTTLPLTAPGSMAAATQSASQIKLSWTAASGGVGGVAGYRVYRGSTLLTANGTTALSYVDTGLAASTLYSNYTAVAYDSNGDTGPASSAASATTCGLPTISSFSGSTATDSQINLSWSASDSCGLGLSSYKVYRDGSLIATISTPSTTSYSDTGLAPNSSHSYTLYAYDSGGNASSATATAGTYPLPSISSFTAATASASSLMLTWSATDTGGPGGLTYAVKRGSTALSCTASPCTDTGLAAGTAYTYTLTATDSKGDAATATASATTYPLPTVSVSATAISTSQIQVTWTGSDTGGPGIKNYTVYRGSTLLSCTSSPCNDTGLAANTSYTYTVYIYDTVNDVGSGTVTKSTLAPAPSVPTGLTGSSSSKSQVSLSWTASTDTGGPGIGGYNIYRGGTKIGTSTTTTYADSGLAAGTTYSYTVSAYDKNGTTSAQSTAVNVTTWYQITNTSGTVISGPYVTSLKPGIGPPYTDWVLQQNYGSHLYIWDITGTPAPDCSGGGNSQTTTGYTRIAGTCEIDASPSVYGH